MRPEGSSFSLFFHSRHVVNVWRPVGEGLPSKTRRGIDWMPPSPLSVLP